MKLTRRIIVTTLADGTTHPMDVETEIDSERPFLVPDTLAGRFCQTPPVSELAEIKDRPVAVDGRRYRFSRIEENGAFELRKDW